LGWIGGRLEKYALRNLALLVQKANVMHTCSNNREHSDACDDDSDFKN
jgi:hypothetical protein